MSSETEVMHWILDDAGSLDGSAPGKLLMIRLALNLKRAQQQDVTRSVELSLDEFERGLLVRLLRGLQDKGLVIIHASGGTEVPSSSLADTILDEIEVSFTDQGRSEMLKQRDMA